MNVRILLRNDKQLKLEWRRLWRAFWRWIFKHWGFAWSDSLMRRAFRRIRFNIRWELNGQLRNLAQLLKTLVLISKFCNGLIGVSLTDSLPALASN